MNNTQAITTNAEDGIFLQETAIGDPIVEYFYLSKNINDGIFAWIAFGIDVCREASISVAATYGEDGGHAKANSGFPEETSRVFRVVPSPDRLQLRLENFGG